MGSTPAFAKNRFLGEECGKDGVVPDLGVDAWKVTWSCETKDRVLSVPNGWVNIPVSLDPLVLVTLSSLIVAFGFPSARLSS